MLNATRIDRFEFVGYNALAAAGAGVVGGFCKKVTAAGGSPTVNGLDDGAGLRMLIAATNEAEILTLYHGDIRQYKADLLQRMTWRMKASAIAANEILVAGLAGDQNDTADSVTYNTWFRLDGSTAIKVETDDNATDDDDNSTGLTLPAATWKDFVIDFSNGLSDVRFFCDDANGKLQRVLGSTTFNLALSGVFLQPFFQLQKASGTTTPNVDVQYVEIEYKRP